MSSLALILHSAFQKHVFRKLLLLFYSHYCADKNENEKVALFDTQTLDINSLNDEMQQKYLLESNKIAIKFNLLC